MNRRPAGAGYRPAARDPGPRKRQMSVQHPPRHEAPASATPVGRVLARPPRADPPRPALGSVADYIPELPRADPDDVRHRARDRATATCTRWATRRSPFTIQSISKADHLRHGAGGVRRRGRAPRVVGVEPTRRGVQLHPPRPRAAARRSTRWSTPARSPRTGLVAGGTPDERVGADPGHASSATPAAPARIDDAVYRSESETGHRNRAIAHLLLNFGDHRRRPGAALELYFRQCSIAGELPRPGA